MEKQHDFSALVFDRAGLLLKHWREKSEYSFTSHITEVKEVQRASLVLISGDITLTLDGLDWIALKKITAAWIRSLRAIADMMSESHEWVGGDAEPFFYCLRAEENGKTLTVTTRKE